MLSMPNSLDNEDLKSEVTQLLKAILFVALIISIWLLLDKFHIS
jgi:hypothetical protein